MRARGSLRLALLAAGFAAASACVEAATRDRPRMIVGPAEVLPYSEAVARRYATATDAAPPAIEGTRETTAIRLFFGGIGPGFPDLATSTRDVTERERRDCASNGVTDIAAVPIGATRGDGGAGAAVPLLLLLKTPGRDVPRGLAAFGREFVSEDAIGPGGYLAALGLVPLPAAEREAARRSVASRLGPGS